MRQLKHGLRKLRMLKFFILPVIGLAYEIHRWKRQDIPHRAIVCSVLAIVFTISLICWETRRGKGTRHYHRHHRHRN